MEVYETIGSVWVELESSERPGNNTASSLVLQLRESMERFQQKIYAVQEAMEQESIEESLQHSRLQEWIGHVKETLDVWERVPNIELASRHY